MKTNILFFPLLLLICSDLNAQKNHRFTIPQEKFFQKTSQSLPSNVEANWYNEAVKNIENSQYFFQYLKEENMYSTVNAKNAMRFDIKKDGYVVSNIPSSINPNKWQTGFSMKSITRENNQWLPQPTSVLANHSNLRIENKEFDIEYFNDQNGLRQNFIIKNKISGNGPLSVNLQLGNQMGYELSADNKLLCYTGTVATKNIRLIYDSLKVWDANGKNVTAFMKLDSDRQLSIIVNDYNAQYPITIDPLNHAPEWTTSADGVLPGLLTNLQLQIDALYGFNVAALGDVNGDGFDDVAIGAPGAIDIISGPSTIVGAGAVFVYFGSASGLPVTPSKVLRASTPVINALFGFSVTGGNVIGDSRNDIIVGAPGESYSASVGGIPSTATVTAGKVYVIRGEDIATANPSPFLSVYLDGSTFFSRGIIGVVGSNISINALFGFSVAVADDMNGDGLDEIVIGAPGYAELALLPVTSGAAFVYYSSALATNTPVKLTAPTSTLLGIPLLNTGGLLFGFSVDGAGDYNQDGKPDIVVGAPAGVNINLGNILGGSAYVYYGNGTGVSTAIGTQLTASASLVGSIANLFGFSVRGIRNAAGERNGNIIASAPVGNVLSNLVGGLRLKTGTVNVFVHKSSPGSSQLPTQQISSPRGTSLLSILGGQNLNVSALFGASMDNMLDVNCDGINDIIVGEPLSTGVGIVNANAIGGAADIFLGKSDGTFQTTPFWTVENNISMDFGINAGSLLGFSVAGARHVRGALQGVRALVGAPGAALDFSSGVLALGNTLGTLFDFAAGDNGLGKAYLYGFNNCGVRYNPDINATYVNVLVPGDVSTNDNVPVGTAYGTPVADASNPASGTIVMFTDGTYTFSASIVGVYIYGVPVCLPGETVCTPIELKITVLSPVSPNNPPVANTDIASTQNDKAVTVRSLENDKCSNPGCSLNTTSVTIISNPSNGIASVITATGDITYKPNTAFIGKDTLMYQVCDNGSPSKCANAMQIISVYSVNAQNTTMAADDYNFTDQGLSVSGNVKTNDTDPEGDDQSVTSQILTKPNVGSLNLSTNGNYTFTPTVNFSGPIDFAYTTCDDGSPSVCANATLHILVKQNEALSLNLLNFNYEVKDCGIKLSWVTSQEVNIKRFVVQNSLDGKNWKSIGIVSSNEKGKTEINYAFVPENPLSGQNFYRLLINDLDGSYQYSKVISPVITCSNPMLSVSPNPFRDKITIRFMANQNEKINIRLSDGAGKLIINNMIDVKEGGNNIVLNNLSNLSSGVYTLSIRTRDRIFIEKLVK
ncbi:MAG: Ig-like domain-containing protein [Ginsengibacter sp.]